MTKGDEVYTTELKVVEDPRTKYTMAERQAQFDLTMKLYNMLAPHDLGGRFDHRNS